MARFAAAATWHGFGSVLSTALQPAGISGALDIYSHRHGFTGDDRHRALLLASHATLALARTRSVEVAELEKANFDRAIESRDVIGQAKGTLTARQDLTADEAFALPRRTSQDLDVKLATMASALAGRHAELDS